MTMQKLNIEMVGFTRKMRVCDISISLLSWLCLALYNESTVSSTCALIYEMLFPFRSATEELCKT